MGLEINNRSAIIRGNMVFSLFKLDMYKLHL